MAGVSQRPAPGTSCWPVPWGRTQATCLPGRGVSGHLCPCPPFALCPLHQLCPASVCHLEDR